MTTVDHGRRLVLAAVALIATWCACILLVGAVATGCPSKVEAMGLADLKRRALEIQRERLTRHAEASFREYIHQAWHVVEPRTPFVPNWHIDAMADHLEAVTRGQIRRLAINVPPGFMKSLTTSVLWPTWEWGPANTPQLRYISTSHKIGLAQRDALKSRRLIQSNWYRARWGHRFALTGDQNVKNRYENDQSGIRMIGSPTSGLTGERGDRIIADDILDIEDADNETALSTVTEWWDGTMQSRVNDPGSSAFVIIMQRLSDRDLCGHVVKRDGYEVLSIPNEYDPKRRTVTVLGLPDPRSDEGALAWPDRFTRADTDKQRLILMDRYEGQYQQQPTSSAGRLIQRNWIKHWQVLPARFEVEIVSVDAAFKGEKDSDFVVMQHWGMAGADKFLIKELREQLDFPNTIEALITFKAASPKASTTLVEDKANGPAIIATLRRTIPGLEPYDPGDKDKNARLRAVAPDHKSGNVYIPPIVDTDGKPIQENAWVLDLIEEWVRFPKAVKDDRVDAMTQAISHLNSSANAFATFLRQQHADAVEAARTKGADKAHDGVQTTVVQHGQDGPTPVTTQPSATEQAWNDVAAADDSEWGGHG